MQVVIPFRICESKIDFPLCEIPTIVVFLFGKSQNLSNDLAPLMRVSSIASWRQSKRDKCAFVLGVGHFDR